MATQFYLPSTGFAAAISPAWSASWFGPSSTTPLSQRLLTTKGNSALTTISHDDASSVDRHFYFGRWISDRLQPQSIGVQTVGICVKIAETTATNNMTLHGIIRLVAANGTTFSDILSFWDDANEQTSTTLTSRYYSASSTARTAVGGDRLVVELGLGGDPGGTSQHDSSMEFGDPTANADLVGDGDATVARNAWVNFGTTTLTFMRDRQFITHV